MNKYLLSALFLGLSSPAWSLESQIAYRLSAEFFEANRGMFFKNTRDYFHQGVVDTELSYKGFRSSISARKRHYQNYTDSSDELILGEAYWDFGIADWEFTLGKKRLNWGVGYAYQPLNIITTESRLATGIVIEEGALMVSAERYFGMGSLTFIAANNKTQQDDGDSDFSSHVVTEGAGFRYYQFVNDWDLQALVYFDEVRDMSVGGSAVAVIGDALTWNITGLWSSRYEKINHRVSGSAPFPNSNPIYSYEEDDAVQFLTGVNYSFKSGLSIILEYWYDSRSASIGRWRNLFDAAREQVLIPQGRALLSAERAFFLPTNLLEHNIMFYFSYENSILDIIGDVQFAPEDQGMISTLRLNRDWLNAHNIEVGVRTFGGDSESVYRELPDQHQFFITFEGTF